MKKGLTLLLILAMTLCFTACEKGTGASTVTTTEALTTTEVTTTEAVTTTGKESEATDTTTTQATETTESAATTTEKATTTAALTTTTTKPTVTTTGSTKPTVKPTATTVTTTATTTTKTTTTTTATTTTTTTVATTTKPTHVHVFAEATCEKAKTCSCGATEGEPRDHEYHYFVCRWCKAKEQGSFVNMNDYYWKYGENDVANQSAVIQLFDFEDDEYVQGFCGNFSNSNTFEVLDNYVKKFCQTWYLWVYDNHYYEMNATVKKYYTMEETDTHVTVTFSDDDSEIKFQKKGRAVLKVISNTSTGQFGNHLPVGAELTAYPRWEDV